MSLISRLFARPPEDEGTARLYAAVVDRARAPHWYVEGSVPDTVDGRFDMVAAVLSLVLLRLEDDPEAAAPSARLTERFVTDMDGQLREIGIGDIVVGKHIGRMMSALGGRLGAYREGLAGGDLDGAIIRNIYRGEAPDPAALAHVRDHLTAFAGALAAAPAETILRGELPA
ncbi:ubiquinol-cytochrome C chaperone [Sphingomonas gilva]|uniref:Ubiquinol-cytochrome C chaperone n=1 Tax=Sphingomonas gilva TaxID=2305907 RepID=A0A396RMV0_9SPHN|nr:ubiquinol-cytochrome C chaperone family protein [Sphingomonas gilva]RHW17740.1 ubiquinol-cytochrome C chaperone [Sphingomonas gilva]